MTDSLTDFDPARLEDLTADLDALRAAKLRAELRGSVYKTALQRIGAFATVRSKDDSKTFARVNRAAMRHIAECVDSAIASAEKP